MRLPDLISLGRMILVSLLVSGSARAVTDPVVEAAREKKLDLPVPIGEPIKGIKIPQYDEAGKLTMSLAAETARKIDERMVELEKLKVQFSDKAEQEIVVEIPHCLLDLESKMLKADSETLIRREDFEIIGQTAEFDTAARRGRLSGHVRASFRNSDAPALP